MWPSEYNPEHPRLLLCSYGQQQRQVIGETTGNVFLALLSVILDAYFFRLSAILTWGFTPKRKEPSATDAADTSSPTSRSSASGTKASSNPPVKRGRLSEMVVPVAPKVSDKAAKRPNNAPIELCVYKYSSEAGDVLSDFPAGVPLWAVVIRHDAYPSVDSDILGALVSFLQDGHQADNAMPTTLAELRLNEKVVVTITNTTARNMAANQEANPQGQPWVNYRCVFYIAGNEVRLHEFLALLHDYFVHRATHRRQGDRTPWPPLDQILVDIRPHTDVVIPSVAADYHRIAATLHDPTAPLPCSIFSVAPPVGNLRLEVEIDVISNNEVAVGFDGRTWFYRERLNMAGLPRIEANLRLLPSDRRDMAQETNRNFLMGVFRGDVFRGLVCNLTWAGEEVVEGTPADTLLKMLRAETCIFEE